LAENPLSGILLLDKPIDLSSSAAVQRVRRAFRRIKAGHTGSLDPLATGMLPICLGEATKVAGYLLEGDKQYLFTLRLGARTTTGDLEGEIVETADIPPAAQDLLQQAAKGFLGPIQQIPPMYSAIKQAGQPLYRLARQGIEVERAARTVEIRQLEMESAAAPDFTFRALCSKGTYIRTLAEDMGRAIGSAAHVVMLRREFSQPFAEVSMVTMAQVETDPGSVTLLPPDAALLHMPDIALQPEAARRLALGQSVRPATECGESGLLRLYGEGHLFLGIGQAIPGGMVKPVRLFNNLAPELS
jgi:tRNA pseudouridine55 synthase